MAYYFKPLKYEPFDYTGDVGPRKSHDEWWGDTTYDESPAQYSLRQQGDVTGQYRGYAGDQFQSLFDAINSLGRNPVMTGAAFSGAPKYSPYQGTRADFTTGGQGQTPSVFDQQAYLDAQFGNMNNYLSNLGSYFGNMGSPQSASAQQILANAPAQGPRPPMPTIGSNLNLGGGGTNINNPFPSFGLNTGGWGTPPTSLFGAGANATIP